PWSSPVFFFQAEDGIRDRNVTGVQTCALPISTCAWPASVAPFQAHVVIANKDAAAAEAAEKLAEELDAAGVSVLFDDRPKVSPGDRKSVVEAPGVVERGGQLDDVPGVAARDRE